MTAQASDVVFLRGQDHSLVAVSDGEPFVPTEHGLRPVMASTACYRGYLCEYAVQEDRLSLSKLHVNHQDGPDRASTLKKPPALNGIEAELSDMPFAGRWLFKSLALPLPYTGGLIIGKGFIQSLYVHMGFHPAWKFEHVHELLFEEGVLVSEKDLSKRMADLRERLQAQAVPNKSPSRDELEQWIADSFRRDYRRRK